MARLYCQISENSLRLFKWQNTISNHNCPIYIRGYTYVSNSSNFTRLNKKIPFNNRQSSASQRYVDYIWFRERSLSNYSFVSPNIGSNTNRLSLTTSMIPNYCKKKKTGWGNSRKFSVLPGVCELPNDNGSQFQPCNTDKEVWPCSIFTLLTNASIKPCRLTSEDIEVHDQFKKRMNLNSCQTIEQISSNVFRKDYGIALQQSFKAHQNIENIMNSSEDVLILLQRFLNFPEGFMKTSKGISSSPDQNSFHSNKLNFCGSENRSLRGHFSSISSDKSIHQQNPSEGSKKPSAEQVNHIYNVLRKQLPLIFNEILDYNIYSQNVIFDNRIKGTYTVGRSLYARQILMLRMLSFISFSWVKFEMLKITQHVEDGTVRVRWRIIGMPFFKSLTYFWNLVEVDRSRYYQWHDGFSTFHIGPDGLVHKHIADKMMPDDEKETVKGSLTSRLVSMAGLTPKQPAVTNSSSNPDGGTKTSQDSHS